VLYSFPSRCLLWVFLLRANPLGPALAIFILYQLSPLLPALPQAAVGILLKGKLHQDPIVRSVCAVILAAGKAALSNGPLEDDHVCTPLHGDEWSRGTLMAEGSAESSS